MRTVFADQTQVRLLNQSRRLKRLTGNFPNQLTGREFAKFVVNAGKS